MLVLEYGKRLVPSTRLPVLHGLDIRILPAETTSRERLVIRLTECEQRDIFLRLCRNIIASTEGAKSELEALERSLARTLRWHRLLKGGRDSRLGINQQRGLIGELLVMVRHLIPVLGGPEAIRRWTGPLGLPHDFEVSGTFIEAKARGPRSRSVAISSEFQLDFRASHSLFLYVTEIGGATDGTSEAITLTDLAATVRSAIPRDDVVTRDIFQERISAVGFDWSHDYSQHLWLVLSESLFRVTDGFPRITPTAFPLGVSKVRYGVSLEACKPFQLQLAKLQTAVREATSDT